MITNRTTYFITPSPILTIGFWFAAGFQEWRYEKFPLTEDNEGADPREMNPDVLTGDVKGEWKSEGKGEGEGGEKGKEKEEVRERKGGRGREVEKIGGGGVRVVT